MTLTEWKKDFKEFLNTLMLPRDDYKGILSYIDEAPTNDVVYGHWIPVTERLPKDGVFVLVCNDDGHMMIAKHENETYEWYYKYTNYDFDIWDNEEQGPVRYYMPLPEPPKEG